MEDCPAPEQVAFDLAVSSMVPSDPGGSGPAEPGRGPARDRVGDGKGTPAAKGPLHRSPVRHTPDHRVRVAPDRARRGSTGGPPANGSDEELAILGLCPGEAVRWRGGSGSRWQAGTVTRRERDGSIGVVDARGASRSLAVERLHVRCAGPRGGVAWEPLTERAGRSEQLCLLDAPLAPPDSPQRRRPAEG